VFVGGYLDDPVSFSKWYNAITDGFLSIPIYFPGTSLYKAVRARNNVGVDAVGWRQASFPHPSSHLFWSSKAFSS
jgi:hypothetical protein